MTSSRRSRFFKNYIPKRPHLVKAKQGVAGEVTDLRNDIDDTFLQYEEEGNLSKNNATATTNPGVNDDVTQGYGYMSYWLNTVSEELFVCLDPTPGNAVWKVTTLTIVSTYIGSVKSITSSPPPTPPPYAVGDRYIVDPPGAGDWLGHDNDLAEWAGSAWSFLTPNAGDKVWVEDESRNYVFNGTAWTLPEDYIDHNVLQNLAVGDVHTQYQLRLEKNAPNGYAGLDGSGEVDDTRHGSRSGGALHALVTTVLAGFMSAADKLKLNGVAPGATNTPLSDTAPEDVTKSAAQAGTATEASRRDHKHDISTAAAGTTQIGDAAAEGTATSLARSDHAHAVTAPAAPVNVTKAAAAAGASPNMARQDHKHDVSTGIPSTIGSVNQEGTSTLLARADHVHNGLFSLQNEPTGFPNRTDSVISRDDGLRNFTIQPAVTSFDFYISGVKFTKSTPQSLGWPAVEGIHFFYFDAAGILRTTTTYSDDLITKYALVALLYWDNTNSDSILFCDERHGLQMDGETHLHLHTTYGARWVSGLALQNFVVDGDGSLAVHAQFSAQNGVIRDEDLKHIITDDLPQNLSPIAYIPILYRLGAGGPWRLKTADTFPVIYQGTAGYPAGQRLPYNLDTAGTWSLAEVGNGNFVLVHYFATNNVDAPVVGIQGQAQYANISDARLGAQTELKSILYGALPTPEMTAIGTVIFQSANGYTNTPEARIRSVDAGVDYVDFRRTELAGATSPGVASVFGFNQQREESWGEDTTTLADQIKVTLTTPPLSGTYRLGFGALVRNDDKKARVYVYNLTDATELWSSLYRVKEGNVDDYPARAGAVNVVFTGAAKTFQLRWSSLDGQAAYISQAFLEFWRFS